MSKTGGIKSEKVLYCTQCQQVYVSNRKKKCCGTDLEECGSIESSA